MVAEHSRVLQTGDVRLEAREQEPRRTGGANLARRRDGDFPRALNAAAKVERSAAGGRLPVQAHLVEILAEDHVHDAAVLRKQKTHQEGIIHLELVLCHHDIRPGLHGVLCQRAFFLIKDVSHADMLEGLRQLASRGIFWGFLIRERPHPATEVRGQAAVQTLGVVVKRSDVGNLNLTRDGGLHRRMERLLLVDVCSHLHAHGSLHRGDVQCVELREVKCFEK